MKITEKNLDVVTGEETVIEREMTKDEVAQFEKDQMAAQARMAEVQAKQAAKEAAQAKLAELGLNVDDLKALGL